MKSILICPSDRPGVAELSHRSPLALAPLLGRCVLDYWIENLVGRGVKEIVLLAADRPTCIREYAGEGRRWGAQITVIPTALELSAPEARRKYRKGDGWADSDDIVVLDHLPEQPELPLFETYAGWFAAVRAWMPRAVTSGRVGVRQLRPGIWCGLHAEIDPQAALAAPCWIGDYVRISAEAVVGPGAILDDRAVVDRAARVTESAVAPDTYVGKHVSVDRSLADGPRLVSWSNNSTVHVPDAFLLADLRRQRPPVNRTTLIGRLAALAAMLISAPFALGVVLWSLLRGDAPWHLRLGLRCQTSLTGSAPDTFGYYELTGAKTWLRRWPQFWNIVLGDMAWFGNRPLRPTQALTLANDFERLWLAAPVGIISLADAYDCPDGISDEAVAHASYYAVHSNRRLDAFILFRSLLRSALIWPIPGHRRKEAAVPLQDLVPRQEL